MVRIVRLSLVLLVAFASWPALSAPPAALGKIHGRIIWVDFWASWCAPCRRSFPWLNEMYRRYSRQGLQIIAVNVDSNKSDAEKFLDKTPADFTVKFDPHGKLAEKFNVQAMPTSYLMDPKGDILQRHLGFKLADRQQYEAQIRAALAGRSVNRPAAQPATTHLP